MLGDLAANFLGQVENGTVVRIESTLTPAIDVPLNGGEGNQTFLNFLRPRVTVFTAGVPVYAVAPGGSPDEAPPWGLVIAGLAAFWLLVLRR